VLQGRKRSLPPRTRRRVRAAALSINLAVIGIFLVIALFFGEASTSENDVSGRDASSRTADFAVTPLVSPRVRDFVESDSDFERSTLLGRIVIPLVFLLLVERELLVIWGRGEQRSFLVYRPILLACLGILLYAQVRPYLG
jgi:hypothetical protein